MKSTKYLILLVVVCLLAGCASTGKKAPAPTSVLAEYKFTPGERFQIYEFHKNKRHLKDGHIVDIRQNIVRRFEILQTDPQKGFWIRQTFGRIEQTRLYDNELTGSAIAEFGNGVTKYKDQPGIGEKELYDRIGQTAYLRVDRFGKLLARGISEHLPANPLSISDWSNIAGFTSLEKDYPPPFSFITSDQILKTGLEWKSNEFIQLDNADSKVEMVFRHRVGGIGRSLVQTVVYGDPTEKIEGEKINLKMGQYFQQTAFDFLKGFVQNVKIEWAFQYTTESGEKITESYLFTSNNTKAKRIKR